MRIRRHFRFYWQRTLRLDVNEEELINQMSLPLRKETLRYMYSSTLSDLPIFQLEKNPDFQVTWTCISGVAAVQQLATNQAFRAKSPPSAAAVPRGGSMPR